MNSAEGQKALESMVGQMLVGKLKQLGVSDSVAMDAVGQLDFDDIRPFLAMTDDGLKEKFAHLF